MNLLCCSRFIFSRRFIFISGRFILLSPLQFFCCHFILLMSLQFFSRRFILLSLLQFYCCRFILSPPFQFLSRRFILLLPLVFLCCRFIFLSPLQFFVSSLFFLAVLVFLLPLKYFLPTKNMERLCMVLLDFRMKIQLYLELIATLTYLVPQEPKMYVEQHTKSLKLRVLGKKLDILFSVEGGVGVDIQNYGTVTGKY